MKKILDSCLNLLSKITGYICIFLTSVATGTTSVAFIYEPEMPESLKPQNDEIQK